MLFWHLGMTPAVIFFTLGRRRIDYRVVLLGAILPDLIDKPIGRIFFENQFQNSRLYGHTLLLAIAILLAVQIGVRGETARRWFILPIAMLIHLALDAMWNDPITLFWPAFGFEFPKVPVEDYWLEVLLRPLQHPIEALKEVAGLAVLVYFWYAYGLHRPELLRRFVKTGELAPERGSDRA